MQILLSVILSVLSIHSNGVAQVPPPDDLKAALASLELLDQTMVSAEYDGAPLADALAELSASSPVPIRADWRALDPLGIDARTRIDIDLPRAPLSTALAAIAIQLGDTFDRPVFEMHAGQYVLTTIEAAAAMRLTAIYDVRDLTNPDTIADLRATSLPGTFPSGNVDRDATNNADSDSPSELPALPDDEPRHLTPGEELILLITDHVDPEAWLQMGGNRAKITDRDGVLIVSAPPSTHRKLRDALSRLRRMSPTALTMECAIIDLDADELAGLRRRYEPASTMLARQALNSKSASVLWRTSAEVAMNHAFIAHAESSGGAIDFSATPAIDAKTGIISLAIDLASAHDDDRRTVKTIIPVPKLNGAAMVELPGAKAEGSVRLLVIIPTAR